MTTEELKLLDFATLSRWTHVRFARSPGPGGQNVNKRDTRVELLFDFASCPLLTDWQKARLTKRLRTRLSSEGQLRVVCQTDRSQAANRRTAEERLVELLTAALAQQKKRQATQPTFSSRLRRLKAKQLRSQTTRSRKLPSPAED